MSDHQSDIDSKALRAELIMSASDRAKLAAVAAVSPAANHLAATFASLATDAAAVNLDLQHTAQLQKALFGKSFVNDDLQRFFSEQAASSQKLQDAFKGMLRPSVESRRALARLVGPANDTTARYARAVLSSVDAEVFSIIDDLVEDLEDHDPAVGANVDVHLADDARELVEDLTAGAAGPDNPMPPLTLSRAGILLGLLTVLRELVQNTLDEAGVDAGPAASVIALSLLLAFLAVEAPPESPMADE